MLPEEGHDRFVGRVRGREELRILERGAAEELPQQEHAHGARRLGSDRAPQPVTEGRALRLAVTAGDHEVEAVVGAQQLVAHHGAMHGGEQALPLGGSVAAQALLEMRRAVGDPVEPAAPGGVGGVGLEHRGEGAGVVRRNGRGFTGRGGVEEGVRLRGRRR
jgi:hypothetical protein